MSLGPYYGRKPSRRNNNSVLGGKETYSHHLGKASVGTYYTYGLKDMRNILESVMVSDGYKPFGSFTNTTSTSSHPTYSNTLNYSNESGGLGSAGESLGQIPNRYNTYGLNNSSSARTTQSNFPYYRQIFSGNDIMNTAYDEILGHYMGNAQGYKDFTSAGAMWRNREAIAVAYTFGGYKDGNPWRQVHRTNVATDQTTNLGIQMDYPGSYTSGANNATTFFLWSTPTDNAHSTSSSRTSAFHMYTETSKGHNSNYDAYNSRMDLSSSCREQSLSFHTAGGPGSSNYDVFNLITETRQTQVGGSLSSQSSSFYDKDYAYHWDNGAGQKVNMYTFSAAGAQHWANHGQQKGIMSKVRVGYAGNEGSYNGGYNYRRWNLTNDSNTGTFGKYHQNMGEENYSMGHDWQYMVGQYNGGGQNNLSHKLYYSNDSMSSPGGVQPTANAGQSSGHCGSRT